MENSRSGTRTHGHRRIWSWSLGQMWDRSCRASDIGCDRCSLDAFGDGDFFEFGEDFGGVGGEEAGDFCVFDEFFEVAAGDGEVGMFSP